MNFTNLRKAWSDQSSETLLQDKYPDKEEIHKEYQEYAHKLFLMNDKQIDLRVQRAPHNFFISTSFFFFVYHPNFVSSVWKNEISDDLIRRQCPRLLNFPDEYRIRQCCEVSENDFGLSNQWFTEDARFSGTKGSPKVWLASEKDLPVCYFDSIRKLGMFNLVLTNMFMMTQGTPFSST